MSPTDPVTPYAGTSGWAGSATSEDRARSADADGTTSKRQALVLAEVRSLGSYGVTVKELRKTYAWHHGQASSVLSVLHKEGRLARLTATRDRCAVYVHPEYVNGRETADHGSTAAHRAIAMSHAYREVARAYRKITVDLLDAIEDPESTADLRAARAVLAKIDLLAEKAVGGTE